MEVINKRIYLGFTFEDVNFEKDQKERKRDVNI